jgi:class 3 adenylate cyclase/tetratricopeptide (TPR) repeat protein
MAPAGTGGDAARPVDRYDGQSERRIVTILFCDVTGSTAIAEQLDPEEWTDLMNGAFQRLAAPVDRYGGTLVRLLGDALLAFFGAPVAHEDDPERAVLAGLEMIEAIQPYTEEVRRRYGMEFTIRIGINTGLVVVGAVGPSHRMEYTAMGDAVNVAARMEQTAAPGAVQIAHDTYRLVAPLFDVEDLGAIEVKGKTEPVRAYRVLRLKPERGNRRGLLGLRAPLIGRETEMAALQSAVDNLTVGQGQIVAVMGEAGLGKSRLVTELHTSVMADHSRQDSASVAWLEGRSLSYESSTPYAPFIDLFAQIAEGQGAQDGIGEYSQLTTRLAQIVPKEGEQLAPYIATLMDIAPSLDAKEHLRQLSPQQLRTGIFVAVHKIVAALARRRSTVLVFEDIHWIDPTSLDLLLSLLPLTRQERLLILVLFRPRPHEPSWHFHEQASREYAERYTSIALTSLSDDSTRMLVDQLLNANELPDSVGQLILAKSEGNPFFVEEVIRSMLDAGWLAQVNGRWHITRPIEQIAVPDTLTGVITARLDRLDEMSKRVVQTAAVIGREFDYSTLAAIADMGDELYTTIAHLQQRELIREKQRQPQPRYIFKHVLTQETAYASLLLSRRRQLHRRVAEVLERIDAENVIEIARHFLEARLPERALPYFIAAGDRAMRAYAALEAIAHYSRGLEAARQIGEPAPTQLQRGRGNAYAVTGEFGAARADFEGALATARTAQDRRGEWQALLDLGELWAARNYAQAGSYLQQALALAQTLGDPAILGPTLNRLGNWYSNTGQPVAGLRFHEQALALFEQRSDRRDLATTLDLLGVANHIVGNLPAAAGYYHRAVAILREFDDRQKLASSLSMFPYLQLSYLIRDVVIRAPLPLDESLAAGREAMQIAHAIYWPAGEAFAQIGLALALSAQGLIGDALSYASAGMEIAQSIDHHQWLCGAYCAFGHIHTVLCDYAQARCYLEEALTLARAINSVPWIWAITGVLSATCLLQNDLEAARAIIDATIGPEEPMETAGQRQSWCRRAELALAHGDAALALQIVERLYDSIGHPKEPEHAPYLALVYGQTLAALSRIEEAESALRQAEQGARTRGLRPLLCSVYQTQVRFYHRVNQVAAARQAANQARAVIAEIAANAPDDVLRASFLEQALAMLPAIE